MAEEYAINSIKNKIWFRSRSRSFKNQIFRFRQLASERQMGGNNPFCEAKSDDITINYERNVVKGDFGPKIFENDLSQEDRKICRHRLEPLVYRMKVDSKIQYSITAKRRLILLEIAGILSCIIEPILLGEINKLIFINISFVLGCLSLYITCTLSIKELRKEL